jgi:hypothetical protein
MVKSSLRGLLVRSNPLITSVLDCFALLAMTEKQPFETASLLNKSSVVLNESCKNIDNFSLAVCKISEIIKNIRFLYKATFFYITLR